MAEQFVKWPRLSEGSVGAVFMEPWIIRPRVKAFDLHWGLGSGGGQSVHDENVTQVPEAGERERRSAPVDPAAQRRPGSHRVRPALRAQTGRGTRGLGLQSTRPELIRQVV